MSAGSRRIDKVFTYLAFAIGGFVVFIGFWDVFLLGRYGSMVDVARRLLGR